MISAAVDGVGRVPPARIRLSRPMLVRLMIVRSWKRRRWRRVVVLLRVSVCSGRRDVMRELAGAGVGGEERRRRVRVREVGGSRSAIVAAVG